MTEESRVVSDEVAADTSSDVPEFGVPTSGQGRQLALHPPVDGYLDLIERLYDEGYVMCVDLLGVDYLGQPDRKLPEGVVAGRFEVVVNLLDLEGHRRIRIRVQLPESDPRLPTLTGLHPGTEAMERETYDMFGVVFEGHPDLSRILLPEDWEGHPLRKDFSQGRIPVQFKNPVQGGDR